MQVLCKPSDSVIDIDLYCPVCGRGFQLYWERTDRLQREQTLTEVREALREQHTSSSTCSAHPESAFNIPGWSGLPQFSAAAILGGANL
jgi:hypothetical protein